MRGIPARYLVPGLVLIAVAVLTYAIGIFYEKFINSPSDFAALIFILAIYLGALYHHLQRPEG